MKPLFPNMDCYLDMDGCLVDMHTPCLKAYHLEKLLEPGNWPTTTNLLNEAAGVAKDRYWDKINADFNWWFSLEPYPWTLDLVRFLRTHFRTLRITTHPQDTDASYRGKRAAIEKHFGSGHPKIIFIEEKHLLARPDRLLIDDTPAIVKAWRQAGGFGMVFPRPWNTTSSAYLTPFAMMAGFLMNFQQDQSKLEPWEIFPLETPNNPGPEEEMGCVDDPRYSQHTFDERACFLCGDEHCNMQRPIPAEESAYGDLSNCENTSVTN